MQQYLELDTSHTMLAQPLQATTSQMIQTSAPPQHNNLAPNTGGGVPENPVCALRKPVNICKLLPTLHDILDGGNLTFSALIGGRPW